MFDWGIILADDPNNYKFNGIYTLLQFESYLVTSDSLDYNKPYLLCRKDVNFMELSQMILGALLSITWLELRLYRTLFGIFYLLDPPKF